VDAKYWNFKDENIAWVKKIGRIDGNLLKRKIQDNKEIDLSRIMNDKVDGLIELINNLKDKLGIKRTIQEYQIDEEKFLASLDEMVEQAFDDQCTGANPRYPLMSEIKAMYLNAYYGRTEIV
jgi:alcohol dehydrogenase class IV